MAAGDWRQRLHAALMELGMPFTADAVEHSKVIETSGELQFMTSPAYKLALRADDLNKALQAMGAKPYRIKVTVGDAGAPATPLSAAPPLPRRHRTMRPPAGRSPTPRCSASAKSSAAKSAKFEISRSRS